MVGYVRVSTGEQALSGAGLEAQRTAIRAACNQRGWTLSGEYDDAGLSGKTLDRPGLTAALEEVSAGRAAGIVVAKLDRLSRSLLDFAGLMERSRREGWALVALDLGLDTSTPQGEMMAAILATFAQFERRLIGERTKSALAELKSQGVVLGRPAAISDEVIGRINQMRTDGVTYRAIAEQLNAEGVRGGHGGQWHAATILRALRARTEQSETIAGAV